MTAFGLGFAIGIAAGIALTALAVWVNWMCSRYDDRD